MGIKNTIKSSQLPTKYQRHKLTPTTDGVMASVYLLDNLFALKLFEKETPLVSINNEIKLLDNLKNLPIAKVVDIFDIDGHQAIVYRQVQGESVTQPTIENIKEIATFLKNFHRQSRYIESSTEQLFNKKRLKKIIDSTSNQILLDFFANIRLSLKDDGIIHGDLFPDNCKFENHKLSGVYDFSDACLGDFNFELAVVAISWCFDGNLLNNKKVEALLESYNSNINIAKFQSYIKYALLYYTTTRFIAGRNYNEMIKRLESI